MHFKHDLLAILSIVLCFRLLLQSNGDAEEIVSVRQGPVKVVRVLQTPAHGTGM